MAAVLFHQNMQQFAGDGGRPERTAAYLGQLPAQRPDTWPRIIAPGSFGFPGVAAAIRADPRDGPRSVTVAGFTELTNAYGSSTAVERIAVALMPSGIYGVAVFNCGMTVGGERGPINEYVAIAIARRTDVLALGRVTMAGREFERALECEGPPFACPWRWSIPRLASADYRFVCFAVICRPGGRDAVAVGFFHNTYKLESRLIASQRLPTMVEAIRTNPVAPAAEVYVGGDFNVEPHDPNDRHPLYPYDAEIGPGTPLPFGGAPYGTSWGGNLYDYWLSDRPPSLGLPASSVSALTRDGMKQLMSDHAGIVLRIP